MKSIGEIIRKHRNLKDYTQDELGNKLSVSKQEISKWENGRSFPDLETTQKLIEILGIDSNEILRGTVQEIKKNQKRLTVLTIVCSIVVVLFLLMIGIQYHEKESISFDSQEDAYSPNQYDVYFGYQDGINPANQYAIDVSMVQLLATPEKYDGKLVRVIGVGNLEFEGNYLSLSKEDHIYGAGNSIWVELGDRAISYDEATEYNGKYVIVEGFFDKDDRGHFDMFYGSLKDVSRYQLWE